MINENGTSFCKRIDENSAINYLWRNTVKKAQFGNDYMAKKKKKKCSSYRVQSGGRELKISRIINDTDEHQLSVFLVLSKYVQ